MAHGKLCYTQRVNYLAHLFLSGRDEETLIGGLLGDFVKGRAGEGFAPAVQRGIVLHRRIDRYTDRHPIVRASCALISAHRRRFAGVLIDLFYDHFLARHWRRYSEVPLTEFTRAVYALILSRQHDFPERLRHVVPRMVGNDWLGGYRELGGVAAAVDGVSRRLCRPNALLGGAQELAASYAPLEAHFMAFFPQLMAYVDTCAERQEDATGGGVGERVEVGQARS